MGGSVTAMISRHRAAALAVATIGALTLAACGSATDGAVDDAGPATTVPSTTETADTGPTDAGQADDRADDRAEPTGFDLPGGLDPAVVEVITPVGADGRVADGWTVSDEEPVTDVDCYAPSGSTLTDGVYQCGPSAVYLPACWPGEDPDEMLCVRGTEDRELFRAEAMSIDDYGAVAEPAPLTLVLADGAQCAVRIGGAWGANKHNPDSLPRYACDAPEGEDGAGKMVWIADADTPLFTAEDGVSTVLYGDYEDELTGMEVTRAVFAGADASADGEI